MINILIVDDQVILRESLKSLIEQDDEIKVAGCAGNGQEALEWCSHSLPDLVLMDIKMPICDGAEGTRLIKAGYPQVKVIVLTTFDDELNIARALQNGADGYVLKDIMPDELILSIKGVSKGMGIVHKRILHTMARQFETMNEAPAQKPENLPHLTPRELDLIRLIVDGKSNREIAAELFLAEGSVKNLLTEILEKTNLKDRTQLAVFAVKNRLV